MIKEILDKTQSELTRLTGLMTVMDPMPVKKAAPHLRLTFMGSGDQGSYDTLNFQLSIVAAGDGPDIYLQKIIEGSLLVHDLFRCANGKNRVDVSLNGGGSFRIHFKPLALDNGGQFIENERDENEQTQFRYTFVEPHVITVSFPRDER